MERILIYFQLMKLGKQNLSVSAPLREKHPLKAAKNLDR
jgi:hypothetical protein